MPKKLTTEEFVRRAKLVHGEKYDYTKVVYVDCVTKVCIICPIHGEFWQNPAPVHWGVAAQEYEQMQQWKGHKERYKEWLEEELRKINELAV